MQLFFRAKAFIKQMQKRDKEKQDEKEEQEQTLSDNKTTTQPSIKEDAELEQGVDDAKGGLKSLEVEDVDKGNTVNPTPTPNDANDSDPNPYKGRAPWSDSQHYETQENEITAIDGEDMELDI